MSCWRVGVKSDCDADLPSLTTMTLEDEALEGSPTIHDDVCVSYDGSLAMKSGVSLYMICRSSFPE